MFVFVSSPYHLKLSYMGTTRNLQVVLTTPTNPYHPKKYLPNFPTQKIQENFKPPKTFDHPRHLKSGVPPGL